MVQRLIRRTSAPLVLTIGLIGTAVCGSGASSPQAPASADHTAHAVAGADEVVMKLIAYQPDALDVPVGTTVTWKQLDAGFHTVTSGTVKKDVSGSVENKPDDTFASEQLAKNDTFTFTFDEAGAYPYFCEIHPATMSGRVSVG